MLHVHPFAMSSRGVSKLSIWTDYNWIKPYTVSIHRFNNTCTYYNLESLFSSVLCQRNVTILPSWKRPKGRLTTVALLAKTFLAQLFRLRWSLTVEPFAQKEGQSSKHNKWNQGIIKLPFGLLYFVLESHLTNGINWSTKSPFCTLSKSFKLCY